MAIVITGTPGTGKSTYAKKLGQELDLPVINITELLKERGLDTEWDDKRNCFLIDVVELGKILDELIHHDPDFILEGHLAHYLPPEHAERVIVTKCSLPELKKRLEERGYDAQKVRENLDCEIFDVCHVEATEFGHDPEVVWTSEQP